MASMKKIVEDNIMAYANPVPYMVRDNWQPVVDYGVSRAALENVARNYYGNAINKLLGNTNNQFLMGILNDARNRNLEQQRLNAMQYGGYPVYPMD